MFCSVFVEVKKLDSNCIYGDSNAILLFTSREKKKNKKKLDFRSAFEIRLLVYQDKWFVSASNWNSRVV